MIGSLGSFCLAAGLVCAVGSALLWLRVALTGAGDRVARAAGWATLAAVTVRAAVRTATATWRREIVIIILFPDEDIDQ